MKINDLKLEHVYRIFQIYEKHVGIEMPDYVSPGEVYLELLDAKEDPSVGWAAAEGTNNTPKDLEAREEAEEWKEWFAEAKKKYLENPTEGTEWQQRQNKKIYGWEIR
jgi:hypothetical protein